MNNNVLPFLEQGVAKIAIVVDDLENTVERYHHLFGIGPWYFYTFGVPILRKMTRYGKPSSFRIRAALSSMGNTRINYRYQLERPQFPQESLKGASKA